MQGGLLQGGLVLLLLFACGDASNVSTAPSRVPCSEQDLYSGWTRDLYTEFGRAAERPAPQLTGCSQVIVSGAALTAAEALSLARGIASDGAACNSTIACVRTLDEISLDGVPVGDAGATVLASALGRVFEGEPPPLAVSVALGAAGIGGIGAIALAAAIRRPTSTVTTLTLEWNEALGAEGAIAIGNALLHNRALRVLGLERTAIDDMGATAIGSALRDAIALPLEELRLEGNAIGHDGAASLAAALEGNTRLRTLNLALNPLGGSAGAAALARGLRRNAALTSLDLSGCGIGDAGAVALATALRSNTALVTLNLQSNGIGATGARALASMLRINPALRHLNLKLNAIGAHAAGALLDALQNGEAAKSGVSRLEALHLEHNLILPGFPSVESARELVEPAGTLPPTLLAQVAQLLDARRVSSSTSTAPGGSLQTQESRPPAG